jgi:3-hydroxyacyl-[acyl-carrier-protein] dehydratase
MQDAPESTARDWSHVKTADIAMIQRVIPHRYPFLLIDRVCDIELGKSARGIKNVSMNEPQFNGHFPGKPILPGVMIVEAMAQTASLLVGLTLDLVDKEPLVYFMSIDKTRFRRMVVPGDVLDLNVTVKRGSTKIWKFDGVATVNGDVAAEAEFMAMIDMGGRK